jgi:hypothetical protein
MILHVQLKGLPLDILPNGHKFCYQYFTAYTFLHIKRNRPGRLQMLKLRADIRKWPAAVTLSPSRTLKIYMRYLKTYKMVVLFSNL